MSEDSRSLLVDKRPENVEGGNSDLQSPPLSRVLDSRVLDGPTKKMSPLKHVSPILKKYSSQRRSKNVKAIRPKTKNDSLSAEIIASSIKGPTSSELPSSQLNVEVPAKPFDVLNDSDILSPTTAHTTVVESFPDDAHETLDKEHDQEPKNDPRFKVDTSPPNQTSKMAKLTHTERKRSRIIKKKNRLQKEFEHTVPLVAVDDKKACEEKGYKYALSYFLKMKERLESDEETFEKFIWLMNDFSSSNHNVVDLYHRIAALLCQYPDLCEEFLAFLLPEQAIQCDRFMEHLCLAEMMSFLRKLEVFFIKQPQHLRKIYSCWSSLAQNPNLTLEGVRSSIIPLLKGNKLLEESFIEILPGAAPPESKMGYGGGPDVEVLPYEDMDSELSDEEKRSERVDVPGRKTDTYGGENCHCCCHDSSDQSYASRSKHCVPCGMKFIAGKVYLQTEHGLRPVRVNFGGSVSYSNNLKRLNSDPRKLQRAGRGPRRSRASTSRPGGTSGTSGTGSKDNSPVKGSGKPTVEEDEPATKQKSPRSRSKSISSRNKEKQPVRVSQQGSARTNPRSKGKSKMCISPPAATYDEIALPAPEPTAAKSDATDFSVLSDVLRQEKIDQAKVRDDLGKEVFQIGSDDSTGEETGQINEDRPDSAVESGDVVEEGDGDVIEEVDGDVISDCSDVSGGDGEGDGDSDEAMSVDSYGESDGDGETEGEGEGSSQESEDSMPRPAWTREEDRVILQCFQAAGGQDDSLTFDKISQLLPSRTKEEIKERFHVLMKLIQQLA